MRVHGDKVIRRRTAIDKRTNYRKYLPELRDDGFYSMTIGASDMGTGCDTTLAQVAAECLECELDDIVVYGVDTSRPISP